MTVTMSSAASHVSLPSLSRLWFGVVAAPAAWTLMELIGYTLAARSCEPGVYEISPHGVAGAQGWVVGLGVITTVIAVIGLAVALGNLRAAPRIPRSLRGNPGDVTGDPVASVTRIRFMASAGVLVSAVFLLGTVLFTLPPLIVNGCVQTR